MEVTFANPKYLLLLIAIPILIFIHFYMLKHTRRTALKFANFDAIMRVTGGVAVTKNITVLLMRLTVVTFLVLAVTGTTLWYEGVSAKYDMVLTIDASSSMLANDYAPNRLEAAKNAASLFIDKVKGDVKVGVVSFSGAAMIDQEPTIDLKQAKTVISNIQIQTLGGTDIGQAIITSANLLKGDNAPKVIILLTDGRSNVGISPKEAINYIGSDNIIVFTIGIGTSEGGAISGIDAAFTLDEETLQTIATATGGKYFHATSVDALGKAFDEIAQFQKKKMKLDLSPYLLLFSFVLLFIEWGLISNRYKII